MDKDVKILIIILIILSIIILPFIISDVIRKEEICGQPSIFHYKGDDGCMVCNLVVEPYWDETEKRYIKFETVRKCP